MPASGVVGSAGAPETDPGAVEPAGASPALPAGADRAMPPGQRRLWLQEQMGAAGKAYHMTRWIHLHGPLDRAVLARALDGVAARHETLRTTFHSVNGEPVQRIAPAGAGRFPLAEHDLRGHPDAERERRRLMAQAADEPFDLERGPLIRGHLIRLPGGWQTLVFSAHHIICDAWSVGVFDHDLGVLYGAFSQGAADPLPPLRIQYADYAEWQRGALAGDELRRQEEFWKDALAGAPPLLLLPADRPRPARQDITAGHVRLELDETLAAGLKALSRRHGTTLFVTLLAAWAVVLGRLAGQDDVVVGTPTANRKRRELTRMIGFLVDTLALRVELGGAPTVAGLLARAGERARAAQRHQDLPFERVVELLQPERAAAHAPLFQVLFTWQNAFRDPPGLPGLALGAAGWAQHDTAMFDLQLTLQEEGARIVGGVKYAAALFDPATVERYGGYLRQVLEGMAADDTRPVHRLPLLPPAERRRVLEEWNATGAEPAGWLVHERFEAQARRTPAAVAVAYEGVEVTYAELNARSNRLAHHLRSLGVGPDARVAVCVERGLELMVGLLAILKAGGAYVPLDPEYPAERLRHMLDDSAPVAVVAQEAWRGLLVDGRAAGSPGARVPVVCIDAGAEAWTDRPDTDPGRGGLGPGHLAYVIYTSGSTGTPKGVMVEHRSLANVLAWMDGRFGPGPAGVVLQKTPISFDASIRELFPPLLAGARLVMARPGGHRDPGYLVETVRGAGIDTLHFVPAMLQAFVEHPEAETCTGVKRIVCGGQALPTALARQLRERMPWVELHNVYGPTETTVDVTAWRCAPEWSDPQAPIGRPMANTRVYVLDGAGEPVPPGVAGEIHVGGAQVARGYLGRPGLTAARFVPDPFAGRPGARLYRTGDLGRWLPDGSVQYLGRNDFQVKVRGFRIEPGEIEARLAELPGVAQAAVQAREDTPGETRLVAYYAGAETPSETLRARLEAVLPGHMVPAVFVRLAALPLTPNGKVDRAALRAPEPDADAPRAHEPPEGPTETALAEIWAEVLGVERVGRHDHFFELGGHSLLAMKLIARMRRRGLSVEARAVFTRPTLAELAAAVDGAARAVKVPENRIPPGCTAITPEMLPLVALGQGEIDRIVAGVPGGAANVRDLYPLAPLQEGILFHHRMAAEGDPYLLPVLFSVDTRARVDALAAALEAVVRRHDILRTAVVWEGLAEPVQVVWARAPLPVDEVELDPAAGDAAEQLRARFDPARHRIDVRRAPLLRLHVAHDPARGRWLVLLLRHHLVSDHATSEVLLDELGAHLAGRGDALPPPPQFRGFVAQARLGVGRAEHQAFFTRLLGDVTEPAAPFGLREARGAAGERAEARLELDAALAARLRERARRLAVSAASVCHLAWAQVLARVSGRGDVVFGTVLFGRMQGGEGAERALGPFLNTLPVRISVDGAGVEAAVRSTHQLLAGLLRHEHASLALAQSCSGVPAPAPLFSALFNYRHGTAERDARAASAREGWEGIRVIHAEGWTHYPLTLSVDDLGDGFWLTAQVRGPVDPARVCALMHTALERLLSALETAPGTPVAAVDVLPDAERRRVVEEWNATDAADPAGACVHQLFEAQARRTPGAVAVVGAGGELTYAELDVRANRLAHHLRTRGVGPDTRVAVCAGRTPEMVTALLAVLKAGGAYVPLDPAYPAGRLRWMLEDSAPVALLAQGPPAAALADAGVPVIDLDAADGWAGEPETGLDGRVGPRNLSYVVYTSGSTGRPKGVLVEHRNLANLIHWHRAAFGVGVGTRSSTLAAAGFDAAVWEIWPTLAAGGVLLLAGEPRDPQALLEWWERQELDVSFLPTPLAELAFSRSATPPRLRTLLAGGDRLRAVPERLPFAVVNNYGPTETTVVATSGVVAAGEFPHIGRPVRNTRVYILDGRGQPVPAGAPGELYVGGAGVARGYRGRPALTAERFVPDAFAGTSGARLYRTGDLGRWRDDGTIDFLGRADQQVKVRGVRVEPGEVEAALAEHPAVREAVVVPRDDAAGQARLVAYWVASDDVETEVEAETLRAHLSQRLPEAMVPAAWVRLDALPLTPHGKVDRAALPDPADEGRSARGHEPPVGEVETALAAIWAEVLGVERVGRHDHFFDRGGHSLVAMRLAARVRQTLGVEVPLPELFAHPVLADFARHVAAAARAELPPIEPVDRGGALALSFAQQRLWFLEQMGSAGRAYHVAGGLRLRGDLDVPALRRALDRVVARHETLRTTFHAVDGQPLQRIAPAEASAFHLLEHDLRDHPEQDSELCRLVEDEAGAPFDLERGALIRGRLIRLAEDDHVLLVTMHHIVSDGWSMGVLTRELGALYAAFARGEADPLPPLPVQYRDYAAWQRRWVGGDVLRRQGEYWREVLAGAPEVLDLRTDHPRPAERDHAGAHAALELDRELTAALKALSQRQGTTLFMTLLAGWAVVLARLSGQEDVVVGTPTANRGRPEIDGLVGFFANTLALRLDLSGTPTVADLLARVKERALDAQQHQDIPFEQVVELVQPARSLAYTPLFQAVFAWRDASHDGLDLPGLAVGPVDAAARVAAKFDLMLSLAETDGRIAGGVEYATALFERATVERHLAALRTVLRAMAADESQSADRLPLLTGDERRQVIEASTAPEAYPSDLCVHQLFEAQARRTPHAAAVVFGGEPVTYAELDGRANRLAHLLRRRGVGPETRVGVSLPRTPELVATLLGVLKAGGAYVPLDPAYPRERLEAMLADARIALVVTESGVQDRLPAGAATLVLDRERAALAAAPLHAPESGAHPENLSHVIFTSGSTGRPRGVMIRHAAVAVLLHWLHENVTDEERSAVLFSTSINFDVSVAEVFGTLCWGGTLVLVENALELPRAGHPVIHASMVPTAAAELLRAGAIPPGVRTLNLGGEALPNALAQGLYALGTVEKVGNLYGPTEDTTYSTYSLVGKGAEQVYVGRPVAGTGAYVLDRHLEPVPPGAAGELYLAGAKLARGYQGLPGLTAERFVPNPFGPPGSRMYRVMDRVRWSPAGELEYLGRLDFQVKVRGHRVEPGEIEARLAEHAAVREAVVIARESAPGDLRLVAYWVGDPVEAETLRSHLSAALPEYMVPAAFVRLDALPLTPNGKVDRRALPAPDGDSYAARAYEPPLGPAEAALAGIWSEVLGVERVGRWDHFFELGGHSLLAVRVVSAVRQALGVEVGLRDLFLRPVLADLAGALETAARAGLPPIERADRSGPLAPSFAQQRLWFLEQMGAGGRAYHLPTGIRLRGALDFDAMCRALDRIVTRHEALRTTFHAVDGQPVQRITPAEESAFHLPKYDLGSRPGREAELRRLVDEEAGAPFDLERGPLIRGRLIRLGEDDHVLLVTMHHIVGDGWSLGVLVRELAALYAAFARGEDDPLPPLPVQYADYAAWQRRWVDGDILRRQSEYWKQTLAGAPELLELPADRPRPAEQDHAGAYAGIELDETVTAAVEALGRRQGTTPFMTVLAAWAVVLGRLAGQDDVVIGTPTANRGRGEIEGLAGFFVNTLALRLDLSGAPTVADLLRRVKERALEAQQHQDIPFEQVVDAVRPARTLAHTPLFQVMFAWQDAPLDGVELPGIRVDALGPAPQVAAIYDLSLSLRAQGGRMVGGLEYATALFDRATVERYLACLRQVLGAMAAGEEQRVDRLPLLSPAERRQVVEEWNATARDYPRHRTLHELFAGRAALTPHAPAAIGDDGALSWAELDARAASLAALLRARGVGPETCVGVCLERSPDVAVALLAVLRAGGVWLPIDPGYPRERLGWMLRDSGAPLVLAEARTAGRIPADGPAVLRIDSDWEALAPPPLPPEASGAGPDNLAYLIYTSGSTGRPKGVGVQHRAAANFATDMAERFGLSAGDRVLQFASAGFDVVVEEIFPAWVAGAAVVFSGADLRSPRELMGEIGRHGVSAVEIPTAYWHECARQVAAGELAVPGCLRQAWVGGERFSPERLREWTSTHVALVNVFGLTETACTSATLRLEPGEDGSRWPNLPVGRPTANARLYVLDAAMQPLPAGVPGELYVGGDGVARGYRGRAALTAGRFVPDPFSPEPGARLYRTGDRARWLADGMLEFIGRIDHQAKIRGFRVEPGEVEAALAEAPGIDETVVVVRRDAPGDPRLVAYYRGEEPLEPAALRAFLAERLPEYMVPAAFVRLAALPFNASGKVDRGALPPPDGAASAAPGYQAPMGPVEEALAAAWAGLLGVERVGRWDDFFERGGHSLLAVQAVSRVRQALGVEVPLRDLFLRPVLADFARGVQSAARAELPPIEPVDRSAPPALGLAQRRLWFLEQLGGAAGGYHIAAGLRLRGPLDAGALRRALDRIVARHEALRTTFSTVAGEPVQRIASPEASVFRLVDHDLTGDAEPEAELRRLVDEAAGAPFDLERGPLVRGRLIRLAEDDHALLVTMHHIVSDGWSMGILVRELGALYAAFARSEGDPLAPLPLQYADYAAWQRRWLEGDVLRQQGEYWRETLAGAPELLDLPTDHPRPAVHDRAGAVVPLELDEDLTAGLKALGQRHGATLFMTLLAGWAAVLGRLAGQGDVVVGAPTANRGRAEIEGVIGFFVNTLALRVDLSAAPSVTELLARVRERTLQAQQNQDIPFEQVVERVRPARTLAHAPLFQALFAWENTPREDLELPGLAVGALAPPSTVTAGADLALSLQEAGGRIVGGVAYATALFERATVERWLGYLRRALEGMAAGDRRPVARLPLLDAAGRRQVLEACNRTDAPYPADSCIHDLIEAQAARTPDAVAVVHEGRSLSYAALNARANRLARYLGERGVGPETRVAVCVEPGPEMMVGLLAVLKAGGAYVPLDPSYPPERLRYLLEDSAPVALLARGAVAERFAAAGVPVVDPSAGAAWADRADGNPDRARLGLTPRHAAYVIYTSGSTGRPRGVVNEHGCVVSHLAWAQDTWRLAPGEAVLQRMSFGFDVSVRELFWPLATGARVVLSRQGGGSDPAWLVEAIRRERAGTLHCVPSLLRALLEQPGVEECASLARVMCGGEVLSAGLARRFHQRLPGAQLHHMYGPTETTVAVTARRSPPGEDARRIPLGGPVANTLIYVLDDHGEPVPPGVAGELCVGGAQVARGYLGRPARTAERFVPDPFGGVPGARLYRTGDLGRRLADGTLEFLGRDDGQVKVRGFRVELGEIEARLREHPAVRDAAVLLREDTPGDQRLVAYCAAADELDAAGLRAFLAERLPAHMVPAAYVRLGRLPLTAHGKTDRAALPAPGAGDHAARGYQEPRGETETALAAIWAELLGVERVGRHDHFFEAGGHSLLATRLVLRIKETLDVEVALRDVFEMPELSVLAEHLLDLQLAQFDPDELAQAARLAGDAR